VQDRLGYECAVEVSNLRPYRITVFNNKMSLKLSDKNTNGNGAAADAAADAQSSVTIRRSTRRLTHTFRRIPRNGTTSRTFYENAWSECSFFKNMNKLERRQRVRASVMAQLEANPELKEAYRNSSKIFQPSNRNAQ
jgi:hypothetical protein